MCPSARLGSLLVCVCASPFIVVTVLFREALVVTNGDEQTFPFNFYTGRPCNASRTVECVADDPTRSKVSVLVTAPSCQDAGHRATKDKARCEISWRLPHQGLPINSGDARSRLCLPPPRRSEDPPHKLAAVPRPLKQCHQGSPRRNEGLAAHRAETCRQQTHRVPRCALQWSPGR